MPQQCFYCTAVAEYTCDRLLPATGAPCRRPLCNAHASHQGKGYTCSSRLGRAGPVTIEYCPEHAQQLAAKGES